MRLYVTLITNGKTATGFAVPDAAVEELGGGKRAAVAVTIGTYTYRTSLGTVDGRAMIGVSAEVRMATGMRGGDSFDVEVVLDKAPREVEVPDDLADAMDAKPAARRTFDAMTYSNRKRLVLQVEGAKAAETRQRRITKIVADLIAGKA